MNEIIGDAFVAALLALAIGAVWPGMEWIAVVYFVLKLSQRLGRLWRPWSQARQHRREAAPPVRSAQHDPSRLG